MFCRLKKNENIVYLISNLIDAWKYLRKSEQSVLTESVDQFMVKTETSSEILKVLNDATDKLKSQSDLSNVHLLILMKNKFLSLFSSKYVQDLLSSDILFLIVMCHVFNNNKNENINSDKFYDDDITMSRNSLQMQDNASSSMGNSSNSSKNRKLIVIICYS